MRWASPAVRAATRGSTSTPPAAPGEYGRLPTSLPVRAACSDSAVRSDAACIACADSYYQPTAGQASCIECALGSQTEGGASQWVTSGAVACDACDSGQYGSTIAVSGITDPVVKCLDCPEGQSQPTTQQTSCVNCGAGQYQPGTGHASCIPCAAGSQTEDGKPHDPS